MSYGYGIGDFLAVSKLALDVYTAYKGAPEDFRNISDEIESLHIIVDRHKDIFRDNTLNLDEQAQLWKIVQGCANVLGDLDKLHTKYMRLGSDQGSSSKAIDRIKWTQENIAELRARLTSNTTLLNTFISSHTHARLEAAHETAHAEVLGSMEEMKSLINGLRRKHSALSLRSIASFAPSVNTREAMKQLCRDLYRTGVTANIIRDRKDQAVAVFQHMSAPVANQEVSQNVGTVAIIHEELLEVQGKGKGRNPAPGIGSASLRGITAPVLRVAAAMGLKQRHDAGTLLDNAAFDGRIDIVRQLLEKGANIEAMRSDNGATPLHTAAQKGHTDIVSLLLEKGANIEAMRSDDGTTPLGFAAYSGHIDVVRQLLEQGANIQAITSENGATPLDLAAYRGHTDIVRLLLEKGANIEAMRSDDGATPLDTAAYMGHTEIVRLLLEKGANIEAMTSDDGSTPLDAAAYNGHTNVVRLLLEKGANFEAMRSDNRATPLDIAAYRGHTGVVRLLLEKGTNIEAMRSSDGSTALYNAAWRGHVGVVRLLLEKGSNIEATTTRNGQSALHAAASFLQTEVVQLLLEKGANIHAATKDASTALHLVFYTFPTDPHLKDWKQLIPTITVLLAHGANILQKNNHGKTPLDLAEKRRYFEAKQLFLQHLKDHNPNPPQEA